MAADRLETAAPFLIQDHVADPRQLDFRVRLGCELDVLAVHHEADQGRPSALTPNLPVLLLRVLVLAALTA